ncbi:MAG: hypothetical protein ABI548_14435 [Polyangiaceae bacterium]
MANWFAKFRGRSIALWQEGKLDDRAFERAQIVRARTLTAALFAVLIVLVAAAVVAGNLSDHTPVRLEQMLLVTGGLAVFGVVIVFRVGRFAHVGARNLVLARNRARAEANPAQGLPKTAPGAAAVPARYFGTYRRSLRYACTVLGISGVGFVIFGSLAYWYDTNGYEFNPMVVMLGAAFVGIAIYGLYMVVDRRAYLELSADGIWCRAWGKERFPFSHFKTVYARQRQLQRGIVFVPRNPEEFQKKLSVGARLMFRNGGGGGVQAHARTVTLWTTQVDVPRDALLREVQAAVVHAANG